MKIINLYRRLRQWFYRKLSIWQLKKRYIRLNEVNKIMEEYVTKRIISAQNPDFINQSRKELITKQNEINETNQMVDFLIKLK